MSYLVNVALEGRAALVVGGGEVAARKVQNLLAAKANVTVVAPQLCDGIVALADEERIVAHKTDYRHLPFRPIR
jgi:siroheme synthase-like protein